MKKKKSKNNKNLLRRIRIFIANIVILFKLVIFCSIVIGSVVLYYDSNVREKLANLCFNNVMPEFTLQQISLEGQHHTATQDIFNCLEAEKGQPLLTIPIHRIQKKLQQLDWIKAVTVERQLPNNLYIKLVERVPVAIWQNKGELYLLDATGHIITPEKIDKFTNLIILVGDGVPQVVGELMQFLQEDTALFKAIASGIRVGERRWNIRLTNGLEIKLPEKNEKQALKYVASLHKQGKLSNKIKSLDLRLKGKIYINGEVNNVEF